MAKNSCATGISGIGMFESEQVWCDEIEEQFSEAGFSINTRSRNTSLTARRKIEQLRELQRLRVLLDDPDIDLVDELDELP